MNAKTSHGRTLNEFFKNLFLMIACIPYIWEEQIYILVQEKIILGVDPGTMVMGYGIILVREKKMELLKHRLKNNCYFCFSIINMCI